MNNFTENNRYLINTQYGYKKSIVRWLKYSKNINSHNKNSKIDKLLKIINQ